VDISGCCARLWCARLCYPAICITGRVSCVVSGLGWVGILLPHLTLPLLTFPCLVWSYLTSLPACGIDGGEAHHHNHHHHHHHTHPHRPSSTSPSPNLTCFTPTRLALTINTHAIPRHLLVSALVFEPSGSGYVYGVQHSTAHCVACVYSVLRGGYRVDVFVDFVVLAIF
jgi:hypothetical protein